MGYFTTSKCISSAYTLREQIYSLSKLRRKQSDIPNWVLILQRSEVYWIPKISPQLKSPQNRNTYHKMICADNALPSYPSETVFTCWQYVSNVRKACLYMADEKCVICGSGDLSKTSAKLSTDGKYSRSTCEHRHNGTSVKRSLHWTVNSRYSVPLMPILSTFLQVVTYHSVRTKNYSGKTRFCQINRADERLLSVWPKICGA